MIPSNRPPGCPASEAARRGRLHRRGVSLVGALVACAVVALGIAVAGRTQSSHRAGADSARQRAEAVRLAQAEIERLRAFGRLGADADGSGHADIAGGSVAVSADGSTTGYTLLRTVADRVAPDHKSVQLDVSWQDRRGAVERVRLVTVIGRRDPALGGALTLPAHGRAAALVRGRDPRVPLVARDLGDGRSLLRLGDAATRAVLIDNASAAVIAACSVPAGTADTADATDCSPVRGLLVTGRVRFSLGAAPSATAPNDAPLAFDMALAQSPAGASAPACGTSAHAAASGERWVDYACLVTPPAGAAGWSGRLLLAPSGWLVGETAGRWRVCRYSADHDASGAVDRAAEHPADYRDVAGPLAEQNFLVVAGERSCPGGGGGDGADNRADLHSTVLHQP